jgi:hypothetical protein
MADFRPTLVAGVFTARFGLISCRGNKNRLWSLVVLFGLLCTAFFMRPVAAADQGVRSGGKLLER